MPAVLQRPLHRFLFDGPPTGSGRLTVTADDESSLPVQFEFVGGCRDGQKFQGMLANPFYWQSDHGRVGARFRVASAAAVDALLQGEPTGPILQHEYEIVENRVEQGVRYVRAEARG